MRVIAGIARSMPLSAPKGMDTRPTTDRIKETLFNMLQDYIPGSVFIDVCSGSGQIGIEALSRGAQHAFFIDNEAACIRCINENLNFTHFSEQATVIRSDAASALSVLRCDRADIVFADPPYSAGYEMSLLSVLGRARYVDEDTLVIIEADIRTDFSFAAEHGFDIIKEKCYKTNKHVWLMKQKNDPD